MKNKLNVLLIVAMIMVVGLGCSMITTPIQKAVSGDKSTPSPNSDPNKTVEDSADDTGESTGVPECDEAIKLISDQSKSKDDNWVTQGIRDFMIKQVKRQLKEAIDQNKDDKVKMAQKCTDLKTSFEKSIKEQQEKDNANK